MAQKTLILGLDACSWDILEKTFEEDRTPTIDRISSNGYTASLESTIPAATCPAWKTMTTGKNPGRLNVFTTRVGSWGGDRRAATQSDFRSADYWDYLNHYGDLSTAIINVPNTYPVRGLDGVMIAGRGIPEEDQLHVYPESEADRLNELGYEPFKIFASELNSDPDEAFDRAQQYVGKQFQTAEAYLREHDVVQLTTLVTDTFEHEWLDYGKTIDLYSYIDDQISRIETEFDDLNIVIVSDHGMTTGPERTIWVNRWLKQKGWLVTESGSANESASQSSGKRSIRTVYNHLPEKLQELIERTLDSAGIREGVSQAISENNRYDIDWENSKAVSYVGGIRVQKHDEELATTVINAFDEDFGHLYPDEMSPYLHRSDIYEGEYADSEFAPDLLENPRLQRHVRTRRKVSEKVVTGVDSSVVHKNEHDPYGVFIAEGPLFTSSDDRTDMKIYDVAPTVLGAYGYQINGELDGEIRSDAIRRNDTDTVPELPDPGEESVGDRDSSRYTDQIEQQLEDLGYLQ